MRTTLTLDSDIASAIKKRLKSESISLKALINSLLRVGLNSTSTNQNKPKTIKTKPHESGRVLVPDLSNIGELLSRMDEGNL